MLTDGRTDGRKIGRLYRTLLQAGAIKIHTSEQSQERWREEQSLHYQKLSQCN